MEEKKPYVVHITETYSDTVVIWAESETAVESAISTLMDDDVIDLSRNSYNGWECEVRGIADNNALAAYKQFDTGPDV